MRYCTATDAEAQMLLFVYAFVAVLACTPLGEHSPELRQEQSRAVSSACAHDKPPSL